MGKRGPKPDPTKLDQTTVKAQRRREDACEITIPAVADSASRARALADPIFFVEHCCKGTLRHALPAALKDFVLQIVQSAKSGGNVLVALPRGSGKTTILQDTLLYCIVADLVKFPVIVASTQTAANSILRNIWNTVENSDEMYDCFPELCHPVRCVDGRHQRCALQTYKKERTNIRLSASELHFADIDGKMGATLVGRGAGGSVRGLLAPNGTRPDWVLIDDPQKAKTARSAAQLDALERYITEDIRGLAGSDNTISVFCAATPIAPGDIVERLAKRNDVVTVKKPLISKWPTSKELWEEYTTLLYGDLSCGTTQAHDFYDANRQAMDDGAEVLDPLAFPPNMSSAVERVYYLKATMGEEAFNQEYLLNPPAQQESLALDATEVSNRLSHVAHRTVPAECSVLLASIDVGTATALHVTVAAYGRQQKAAIVDAYRFPDEGRLGPKDIPQEQSDKILSKALVGVITNLIAPGRYRKEVTGKAIPITAIAIDRGFRTTIVDSVAAYFIRRGVYVVPTKGFPNTHYRPSKVTVGKAENCDLRDFGDGMPRWLAYNADTLKVQVMKAFRGEPLTTGSLCLWGNEPSKVFRVAQEIAGEKLIEVYRSVRGDVYRWAMGAIGIGNHFLDTAVINLALAEWLRYRQSGPIQALDVAETQSVVEAEPETKPKEPKAELKPKSRDNPAPFRPSSHSGIKLGGHRRPTIRLR